MHRTLWFSALLLAVALTLLSGDPKTDPRLTKASRAAERNGWIQVHLEGSPAEIGFQHGYLLAPEIEDTVKVVSTEFAHDEKREWGFYRDTARDIFWPRVEEEYRAELNGIAEGVEARGSKLDLWDIVALNSWLEVTYYTKQLKHNTGGTAERCSAFVATGSYTADHRVVIGHNSWTGYADGERWNIVFDIVPAHGYHILMDGMAGLIDSGDDFGINSAGILITETTIGSFSGFDPNGIPEFVRARKAMQYAASIDDFARIMKEGNNGGYANNWLVADRNTNEIADLEMGLKNVNLWRTRDGFFAGSNFPIDPKLIREETTFKTDDAGGSANARHARWLELMEEYRGKIDIAAGQRFLGDHYDTFAKKVEPSERTLCGHIDLSPRGVPKWLEPYAPAGAVENKVTSAALAAKMAFTAALGHACGRDFHSASHLAQYPQFAWYRPILRDMDARPWTEFQAK
ncbi:MAG: C45 family peptidase [Bryobacteraceae bacterium]